MSHTHAHLIYIVALQPRSKVFHLEKKDNHVAQVRFRPASTRSASDLASRRHAWGGNTGTATLQYSPIISLSPIITSQESLISIQNSWYICAKRHFQTCLNLEYIYIYIYIMQNDSGLFKEMRSKYFCQRWQSIQSQLTSFGFVWMCKDSVWFAHGVKMCQAHLWNHPVFGRGPQGMTLLAQRLLLMCQLLQGLVQHLVASNASGFSWILRSAKLPTALFVLFVQNR